MKDIVRIAEGKPVTIETKGGFRVYGHDLGITSNKYGPETAAVTCTNGRTVVPWHAVNLIHVHDEEEE